ncbi:MAG TPA: hypothetical protein VEP50_01525 [bacterium]|nr:hypothetical protein [bacterium]
MLLQGGYWYWYLTHESGGYWRWEVLHKPNENRVVKAEILAKGKERTREEANAVAQAALERVMRENRNASN